MASRFVLFIFFGTLVACSAENTIVLRDESSMGLTSDVGSGTNGVPIQDSVSTNYKARYTVGEPLVGQAASQNYRASIGVRDQF